MDFLQETKKLGLELTDSMLKQFELYYHYLIEVNSYMNLTAITQKEDVYRKHFLDSLELFRILSSKESFRLCDVGSGAGFPGIPLAIVNPQMELTIIDSLNKRIDFLKELAQKLDLKNVLALHERAEVYANQQKDSFDVVTARAVAKLPILVELCLPLVKVGGMFIAMKGSSGEEELALAEQAIQILGGKFLRVEEFYLPEELEKRQIIIIQKIKPTPAKYPRSYAKIKERPL